MQRAFKQKLLAINAWFNALNPREKLLISVTGLAVLYGIYSTAIEPMNIRHDKAKTTIQNNESEKHSLELQLNALTHQNQNKKQTPEEIKVAQLQQELKGLTAEIDDLKTTLIKPENMPDLLNDILEQDEALQLVELKTLPPTGLFEAKTSQTTTPNALPVFKHGVELTVKGRYLDLMHYLSQLEALPWHILWEKAVLTVEEEPESAFPLSQLTLVVYSLSLDKAWLAI